MEDLQDALQSILSDPEQMARVAALAESLGLNPPNGEATGNRQRATGEERDSYVGAVIGRPPEAEAPETRNDLNLEKAMGILSASSGGEARVLSALRPTLGPEGQSRVDRALRAAKLSRLAGALLTRGRRAHV